ncbi:hypothetical protein [Nocardioides antri]|nr:hypothetical protein [Nocardioides antri]
MNEPPGAALLPAPAAHEHTWRLVSVESDCGMEVRELLCPDCDAVRFEG